MFRLPYEWFAYWETLVDAKDLGQDAAAPPYHAPWGGAMTAGRAETRPWCEAFRPLSRVAAMHPDHEASSILASLRTGVGGRFHGADVGLTMRVPWCAWQRRRSHCEPTLTRSGAKSQTSQEEVLRRTCMQQHPSQMDSAVGGCDT